MAMLGRSRGAYRFTDEGLNLAERLLHIRGHFFLGW